MTNTYTLLLLYSKLSASVPVAHALTEKGIQVLAVDKSADLVQYMQTRTIDLIGLSVSHPNFDTVYELLNKSAKIPLFTFAEENSRTTKEKLDANHAELKIQGVASGYTIWKTISPLVRTKVGVQEGKIILSGMKDEGELDLGDVIVKKEEEENTEAQHVVLRTGDERFSHLGKVYTEDMKKLMDCVRHFIGRNTSHEIQEHDKVGQVTKMTAFIVGSHSEHGILLMGTAKEEHLSKETIEALTEAIKKEFKGLPFKVEDVFQLDVKSLDVCAWARQHSLFTFIYDNNTSFASLLKCGRLFPELVPTEQPDMRSMRLDYLPMQDIADFDIYLYFSRNDKLLPYIKKGEAAAAKIQRMVDRGLHVVFIHEADRLRLHTACVQDFVQGALDYTSGL